MTKRNRFFHAPRLPYGGLSRKVPEGKFKGHNHIQHCVGMRHGLNGFPCWNGLLPINYRKFERRRCGWIDLPHYKIRGRGGSGSAQKLIEHPLVRASENSLVPGMSQTWRLRGASR